MRKLRAFLNAAPQRQRGFTLVPTIFLIVVLATIGVLSVRISLGQQQTVNLSLLSSRALAAANSGVEWAAYDSTQAIRICNSTSTTLTLSQGGLAGFTVKVTCTTANYT